MDCVQLKEEGLKKSDKIDCSRISYERGGCWVRENAYRLWNIFNFGNEYRLELMENLT